MPVVGLVSDTLLMCQRKLPPSFWNSAYQPPPSASTSHGGFPLGADAYFSPSLYGLHKSWPYPYSSQAHTYGHQVRRSLPRPLQVLLLVVVVVVVVVMVVVVVVIAFI